MAITDLQSIAFPILDEFQIGEPSRCAAGSTLCAQNKSCALRDMAGHLRPCWSNPSKVSGHAFLNRPETSDMQRDCGSYALGN